MTGNDSEPLYIMAKKAGISVSNAYARANRIAEQEGKARLPTLEELAPKKVGRPRKFI